MEVYNKIDGSAFIGELFSTILKEQFYRSFFSDRNFYYFNKTLREYVKDITLKDTIQRNTNLKDLPDDIFSVKGSNNYILKLNKENIAEIFNGKLSFSWIINKNKNEIKFEFILHNINSNIDYGWIGIGFGYNQYMKSLQNKNNVPCFIFYFLFYLFLKHVLN